MTRQQKNLIACLCAVMTLAVACLIGFGIAYAHYQSGKIAENALPAVAAKVTSTMLTENGQLMQVDGHTIEFMGKYDPATGGGRVFVLADWVVPEIPEEPEEPSAQESTPEQTTPQANDGEGNPDDNDDNNNNSDNNDNNNDETPGGENPGGSETPDGDGQNAIEPSGEDLIEAESSIYLAGSVPAGNAPQDFETLDPMNPIEIPGDDTPTDSTDAPTEAPGDDPTDAPTEDLTDAPTEDPGNDPATDAPTEEPTEDPGTEPSDEPDTEESPSETEPTEPGTEESPSETEPETETEPSTEESSSETEPESKTPARRGADPDEPDLSERIEGSWKTFSFRMESPRLSMIANKTNYTVKIAYGANADASGLNKATTFATANDNNLPLEAVLCWDDNGTEAQGTTPAHRNFTLWLLLTDAAWDILYPEDATAVEISVVWTDPTGANDSLAVRFVVTLQPTSDTNSLIGGGDGMTEDDDDLDSDTGDIGAGEGSDTGDGPDLDGDGNDLDGGDLNDPSGSGNGNGFDGGDLDEDLPEDREAQYWNAPQEGEDLPEELALRVDGYKPGEDLYLLFGVTHWEAQLNDPAILENPELDLQSAANTADYEWVRDNGWATTLHAGWTDYADLELFTGLELSVDGKNYITLWDTGSVWKIPASALPAGWNGLLYLRFADSTVNVDGEKAYSAFKSLFAMPTTVTYENLANSANLPTMYRLTIEAAGTKTADWAARVSAAAAQNPPQTLTHLSQAEEVVDAAIPEATTARVLAEGYSNRLEIHCPYNWQGAIRSQTIERLVRSNSGANGMTWQEVSGTRLTFESASRFTDDLRVFVQTPDSSEAGAPPAGTYRVHLTWTVPAGSSGSGSAEILATQDVYFFITY